MANPKFSIVIPTRERHETLKFALQTCVEQEFDDYEIVVCDNHSSEATKQVVDAFDSPRIRYHRSDRPLSMQDNWNLAYSLTRGDWITFIGDDDGILPFGLRQLDLALKRHDVQAVRWNYAVYSWPTIIDTKLANYLQICTARQESVIDSRALINDVLNARCAANLLPNVYHSCVSRKILDQIRDRSGAVFSGFHPDTYTSFGVAYLANRHLSLTLPISCSGFSGSSNNIAFSFVRRKHDIAERQQAENAEHGLHLHPWIADLPTLWAVLGDSFLRSKNDIFPHDRHLVFDRKFFAERFLREMPIDEVSEWPVGVTEIRRSLEDDPALLAWFDKLAGTVKPRIRPRDQFRPRRLGPNGDYLHIDTSKCQVADVVGATRLAAAILNYDRDDLDIRLIRPKFGHSSMTNMQSSLKAISRLLRAACSNAGIR